jgi:hypothetical protein
MKAFGRRSARSSKISEKTSDKTVRFRFHCRAPRNARGYFRCAEHGFISVVTRGLDPRVHLFRKKMDCFSQEDGLHPNLPEFGMSKQGTKSVKPDLVGQFRQ